MAYPIPIPETGQELEIVRLHTISWTGTVKYIRELRNSLSVRTLIINPAFAVPENVLVDALLQFVRNYMLTCHFAHYQRLGVDTGTWTPAKGRLLFQEDVPEVFTNIARHLARPRLLVDGSATLPNPTCPICNGALYDGLAAVTNDTPLRNGVTAGRPLPVLHAIEIENTRVDYRPRIYMAIRRNFSGLKFERLSKGEGLHSARFCFWDANRETYVSFLDQKNEFEKCVFEIDCILQPHIIDEFPDEPDDPGPAATAAELRAFMVASEAANFPPGLQWMGLNPLTGVNRRVHFSEVTQILNSGYQINADFDIDYAQAKSLNEIGNDLNDYHFPALGVTELVTELRVLVNDFGQKLNLRSSRNARRSKQNESKRTARRAQAAQRAVRSFPEQDDQKDNGAATTEEVSSNVDVSDRDGLKSDASYFQNRRRMKKKKRKPKG